MTALKFVNERCENVKIAIQTAIFGQKTPKIAKTPPPFRKQGL